MLLRNHDHYLDMLYVDVASDARERRAALDKSIADDGFFFEHNDDLFALGSESGTLYVILNGKLIKDDDNSLQTQLTESPDLNTFTATHHADTLCRVSYTPIKASGWTPNEDDECLNGFLLMHNILQSSERRSLLTTITEQDG